MLVEDGDDDGGDDGVVYTSNYSADDYVGDPERLE